MTSRNLLRALLLVVVFSLPRYLLASDILIGVAADPLYLPLYVATSQGYFHGEGSRVELRFYPSAGQALEGLAKGEVHLAGASEWNILAAYSQGADLTMVALFAQAPQAIKLVARSWVKGRGELAKRKMGVQDNLASQYFFYRLDLDQGVNKKRKTATVTSGSRLLAAFQKGQLDAFVALEPWPTRAIRFWKDKAFFLNLGSSPYVPSLYLVAADRFLAEKRSAVAAILRELAPAIEFINKEPGRAAEIMARRLKLKPEELARLLPSFVFSISLNYQDKERVRQVAAWLIDQGQLEIDEVPEDFFASGLPFQDGQGTKGKLP